jgi:methenyltetrahydrofolate cyclohydrolase
MASRAKTFDELLADVAAATPAPGGGSAAGWACALSAGLVEMTARFTLGREEHADGHERMAQIAAQAAELRRRAGELAERELHAYEPVLEAQRLPASDPQRPARLDAALSQAAQAPLEIARVAGEVAALALEASRYCTRHLRGDALTGLLLAEGACQAAAQLVRINLAAVPRDLRLIEIDELTETAAATRAEALSDAN